MKTPYDTALRAMRRDVDDLRTAIGNANGAVIDIEQRRDALSAGMRREAALSASDWTFPADAYLARARAQREALVVARVEAEAQLEALRHQAVERYGSLRAVEGAADLFREDADRAVSAAEQAQVDDFAGARFARQLHRTRARSTTGAAPR